MSENKTDNRTATQRIEDLERVVSSIYTATSQLIKAVDELNAKGNEVPLIKEALKILNRKAEAIIRSAAAETGITDASVSAILIQLNTVDLQNQVAGYVASGQLAPSDEVKTNGYLVCEETNATGEIVNPRIQFRLDSQNAETQALLLGKKPGESVSFGENKYGVKILETYTLENPALAAAAPEAAATPAPAAETAPEAAAPAETAQAAPASDAAATPAPADTAAPAAATTATA